MVIRDAQGQAFTEEALWHEGAEAPSSTRELEYRAHGLVKGLEYHASATLRWHIEGQRYSATQTIRAFLLGSLQQTSAGRVMPHGLQPEQFDDRRLGRLRSVQLDWERETAHFQHNGSTAPIGHGTQDRLSVLLQLALLLQHQPALQTPGTRIHIPTLGARRLQNWEFVVMGTELQHLPAGAIDTLRLVRSTHHQQGLQAQLWLAPALGFAPVRLQLTEDNGDVVELQLKASHHG